jgi:hypothetical protein
LPWQPENSNDLCVSTVFARVLSRLIDSGSDRRCRRRVCAETQSDSNKCNAAIVPQRLHGSLLIRSDRWCACPELPEAEPRESFTRVPNRRESNWLGFACGSRVGYSSESSGPSRAVTKYVHTKYVHTKYVHTKYVRTKCAHGRGAANPYAA